MTKPPIPFWGIKMAKKGYLWHFCYWLFLDHKICFLAFFVAKMTKIVILDKKLIVPNDYQQFWVHFEWFLSLFQISDEK